ncbi:MAG TPA: hypothetical protein VFX97_00685 [Pyrinomonadaceae bacterium]|nr:hypothetical protein [Pyrinomonadaceae bacterium]
MLRVKKRFWIIAGLGLVVAGLLRPAEIQAQDCAIAQQAGINQAVADPATQTISLAFDLPLTPKDKEKIQQGNSWILNNLTSQANPALRIDTVTVESADSLYPDNFLSATLHYTVALVATDTYVLSVPQLTFSGCKPAKLPFTTVSIAKAVPAGTQPNKPSPFSEAKSTGRADSDIYIAGQLEGSKGETAVKTVDAKIQLPIGISLFREQQDLVPFFEFKMSSNKKADADSLKLGALIRSPFAVNKSSLKFVVWDTEGRLEGNKNFKHLNGIWGNTLYFLPPVIGSGKAQLFLQPMVGLELGRNFRNPVPSAEHRNIARAVGGASAYLNFFTGNSLVDSISLQTDYVRRWPLRGEISFTEDDKKNLIPLFIGRNPRDYVQTKIQFEMSKYFAITIGHEYGSLPPNFKLVDNKYSVGFVYKKKLIFRPK